MGEQRCGVAEILAEKLRQDKVADQVASLVTSAIGGGGEPSDAMASASGQARAYLKSVTVQGFRGIGPKVTLHLQPGPGLTVVTGRNGSGKSSFAEAAELALTGDNKRWSERTVVWREGWRNLHDEETAAISVSLTDDGQPMPTVITREWPPGAGLDSGQAQVSIAGERQSLVAKGWDRPLELYRPFLSYSELGALVSGQPSKMHDALQAILGLDVLIHAERTLGDSRRSAESVGKVADQQLPALREKLAAHPDERARAAEKALDGKTWDLEALAALVGDDAAADGRVGLLQGVVAITLPTVEVVTAAVARLESARASVEAASLAREAWLGLAGAAHHHAYELAPTAGVVRGGAAPWGVGRAASLCRTGSAVRDRSLTIFRTASWPSSGILPGSGSVGWAVLHERFKGCRVAPAASPVSAGSARAITPVRT